MAALTFLVCTWLVALLVARARGPTAPATTRVAVDDAGVARHLSDGSVEYVAWRNLVRVDVVTTDGGPFVDDFFFVLHARDGRGCLVPNRLAEALLPRLQRLPGFDARALIEACGSTSNARFRCWRAADA